MSDGEKKNTAASMCDRPPASTASGPDDERSVDFKAGWDARDEEVKQAKEDVAGIEVKIQNAYVEIGRLRVALEKIEFSSQAPYKNGPIPFEIQHIAMICSEALRPLTLKDSGQE